MMKKPATKNLKTLSYKEVPLRRLVLYLSDRFRGDGADLRLAITGAMPDVTLLHNHDGKSGYVMELPSVRYVADPERPSLVAMGDGLEVLEQLHRHMPPVIRCRARVYDVRATEVLDEKPIVGVDGRYDLIESVTPWLALNERRFSEYDRARTKRAKMTILRAVATGNCLALAKSVQLFVHERVRMEIVEWSEVRVRHKNVWLLGINARLRTNFHIPRWVGIGKIVSKGYGLFRRRSTDDFEAVER